MNEHIKQLADEAAQYSATMALPTGESGDQLFVERFAELIAIECIELVERHGSWIGVDYIKQYFGVRE